MPRLQKSLGTTAIRRYTGTDGNTLGRAQNRWCNTTWRVHGGRTSWRRARGPATGNSIGTVYAALARMMYDPMLISPNPKLCDRNGPQSKGPPRLGNYCRHITTETARLDVASSRFLIRYRCLVVARDGPYTGRWYRVRVPTECSAIFFRNFFSHGNRNGLEKLKKKTTYLQST